MASWKYCWKNFMTWSPVVIFSNSSKGIKRVHVKVLSYRGRRKRRTMSEQLCKTNFTLVSHSLFPLSVSVYLFNNQFPLKNKTMIINTSGKCLSSLVLTCAFCLEQPKIGRSTFLREPVNSLPILFWHSLLTGTKTTCRFIVTEDIFG